VSGLRVLVLTNLYPPAAMGGYELSCRDVVERWRARGHEVTVLTTAEGPAGTVEPPTPQPHVHRELEWYWRDHRFERPTALRRLALERRNAKRLRAALTDTRPDVVSVWHLGGMSLAALGILRAAGVPVVLNVCDDWLVYGPRVDAWTDAWSRRPAMLARLAAAVTRVPTRLPDLDTVDASFVSRHTLQRAREDTRWSFPRATVVGSGIDDVDFPRPDHEVRPWGWLLLAVGRVEPRKGFDSVVRALAKLPEARLRVLGVADPRHLAELRELAARLGVDNRWEIAAVPRTQLAAEYRNADAALFTPRWEEPFGLVPIEAMSQATPVVATRRGGSAEFLVDGENCLAVPPDDPDAVAAAVRRLAADEGLRDALVAGGLRTAEAWTVDRLADRLERLHLAAAAR
jgi:glycogen(starch) synthase